MTWEALGALAGIAALILSLLALWQQHRHDSRTGELEAEQARIAGRLLEIEEHRHATAVATAARANIGVQVDRSSGKYGFVLSNSGADAHEVAVDFIATEQPAVDLARYLMNPGLPLQVLPSHGRYRIYLGDSLEFGPPFQVTVSWRDEAHPDGTQRTVQVAP